MQLESCKVLNLMKIGNECRFKKLIQRDYTPDRRKSKTLILLKNVDKIIRKFLIAICRPIGKKWHSKTLFLLIFDVHLSIVKSVFDCRLSGVDKG